MSEQDNEMTMIEKLSEELGEKELKIMELEKEIKRIKKKWGKTADERNRYQEALENNNICQCEKCFIYEENEEGIEIIECDNGHPVREYCNFDILCQNCINELQDTD